MWMLKTFSPEYEREISSVKYDRQGKFAADTFTSEPTTGTNKSKGLYTAQGSPLSVHRNLNLNFIGLGLHRRWIDGPVMKGTIISCKNRDRKRPSKGPVQLNTPSSQTFPVDIHRSSSLTKETH
jgi:hypothetical protein